MARPTDDERLLSANAKVIEKAVRRAGNGTGRVAEYRIRGARGLVLHVMPSGTATWYLHYDVVAGSRRHRRKHKLGRFEDIGLAEAIAEAEHLRSGIRRGFDPAAARSEARTALTFADLAEARIAQGDPLRPSTESDYRLLLNRDVLPAIGALPAAQVSREHVIALLDSITARGATRRADTARAVISSIFGFGLDRGLVTENPARDLRNRHDYQPRDVILSASHLARLCSAMEAGEAVMSAPMIAIFRLALLTGQRRKEIAELRKVDLDLDPDRPCLLITRGQAKNANKHRVPLSTPALALVQSAMRASTDSPYLFPGPEGDAIHPRSVSKAMERTRVKLGFPDVTVHDLRRTVGSMMTQYGVPRDVRERVLNHGGKRKGSITESVYSWYDYDAEKRAALQLWADALMCMAEGRAAEIADYNTRLAQLKGSATVRIAAPA